MAKPRVLHLGPRPLPCARLSPQAQHRAGVTPLPPEEPHPGPEPPSKALPSGTGPTPPPHVHLPVAAVRGCVGKAEGWGCLRACGARAMLSDLRQNPQSPEALADPIPFSLQRGWKRRTAWCSQPSPGWREPPSSRSPRESHRAAPCPPRSCPAWAGSGCSHHCACARHRNKTRDQQTLTCTWDFRDSGDGGPS